MSEHAFVAQFGTTVIKGHTFSAVGDALEERGYVMSAAIHIEAGVINIPHKARNKPTATMTAMAPEPTPVVPVSEETLAQVAKVEQAIAEIMDGKRDGVGLLVRPCGSVHSDGVACLVPVYYEPMQCGCGDYTYQHDGPHESVDDEGVKYRWNELLIVQDCDFDAYGPMAVSE